jgi:PIN domain nuclease of toxin-antitoxin system
VTAADQPLLLDTSAFLFWHADSRKLSKRARTAMLDAPERPIFVSAISAFEIATKVRLGKLDVPTSLLNEFAYVVESDGFRVMDLDAASAVRAGLLSADHRDPFDRLLAAQAIVHRCAVVTPDRIFKDALGAEVFW